MVRPGRYGLYNGAISNEALLAELKAGGIASPDIDIMTQVLGAERQNIVSGAIVTGIVRRILADEVVIDINYKSEGYVPLVEFSADEQPEPGRQIEVYIEEIDDDIGQVHLSKRKADRMRSWERIMSSHDVGDVVTGKAIRKIKGGLLVDIGVPVFLPASQVDIRRTGDVVEYIGRDLECKIIKIDRDRRNIVLSRRKLLEEDRDRKKSQILGSLVKGEIRKGIVKNITDFGAFVDLGGIDGLLHITDMSWGRVSHPSEVVKIDQEIEVCVLEFDPGRERISLGLRQVKPSPWETIAEKYPINSRHRGPVVNIMPYGAFVRLEDGIEGLVHISEMSWTRQVNHPSELVQSGQEVEVMVLEINQDKQELSLGMKQCTENPWTMVQEKYTPGTIIEGKVRNMTNYGAFIEIEEGIDGLLHVNDMSWTKKIGHPSNLFKRGDVVRAKVLSVDQDRKRVALGLKQLEEDPWLSTIPNKYHLSDVVQGTVTKLTNFGAFVEIADGLEGLLHISEMADHKVERPEEVVKVGDKVTVMILNIDTNDRKIGLSLRATETEGEGKEAATEPATEEAKTENTENKEAEVTETAPVSE